MTDEAEEWLDSLDAKSKDAVLVDIGSLEELGPNLGRPYVETLKDSRHSNLKELRTDHDHHHYRIAFAFDPKRHGILLIGGDKTGADQKRFYKRLVKDADTIFDRHLAELAREKAKQKTKEKKP